jgi:hypothetical protein
MGIDGLAYNKNNTETYFVRVNTNSIIFNADEYNGSIYNATTSLNSPLISVGQINNTSKLILGYNNNYHRLGYYDNEDNLLSYLDLYQDVGNNITNIQLNLGNVSESQVIIDSNHADYNVDELSLQKNLHLGASTRGQGYMLFQQVNGGYDLYI